MFTNHVYGIDLGSNMIKIYSQKSDEILKERNMIAIRNKEDILAVGDDAYEMYEKNPANITVSSPMSNGMIANIGHLEILLHNLLEKTSRNSGSHPVIYFAVPVDMTEIEKTRGSMIVNIGAATTEISVIADSRVIISKIIPLGGDYFNQEILNNIRRRNNFFVSLRTAGRLKTSLADLKQERKLARKIVGVDCVSGLPRERIVTSTTINESILSSVKEIAEEIRTFLDRTPPQIHKVILAEGIYLTGGSTRIPYIAQVISRQIGCPILLSQYYDLCTVYGLKEIITHDALHHWAFTPKKRKK